MNGQVQQDLADWRIDAIVTAAWATELCLLSRSQAAAVVAALGLPGTLDGWTGSWRLTPPPRGTERFALSERGDDVFTVEMTLSAPGPTCANLNAILGPGGDVVRVHYDQPYPVCYRVTVPEARTRATSSRASPPNRPQRQLRSA